jgi:D-alanyl-D-alanine carboxypeptidase/D-alanyl-D-alanine-endopeptidase (penicillin-binding protein 4)
MKKGSRHIAVLCAAAAVLTGLTTAANADTTGPTGLDQDLDTLLANSELAGSNTDLVVRDADTGATLYAPQDDTLLVPASNEKLITSAAAMDLLGPDYTFSTNVLTNGTTSGSTLTGNLYLKGTGDPTTLITDYQNLAAQVAATGVTTISGQLVADDTYFDSVRYGPDWAWDDEPYSYNAQISGLTFAPNTNYDSGSMFVNVKPGTQGQAPTVTTTPPSTAVTIVDNATTGAAGSTSTASVSRTPGTNTVTVTGSIPAGAATTSTEMSVENPTAFAAALFRKALADDGVTVTGSTTSAATPSGATQIATHASQPLSQLLVPFLKLSNNMMAEALTKAAGRKVYNQGTFASGVKALDTKVTALGIDTTKYKQVDGSGLSRMDLVTGGQLVQLLIDAQSRSWFTTWYNALPIAGNPAPLVGGTLASRMVGTSAANNVHAKTGSETGVSALSGYVTAANGEHLVFALTENDFLPSSVKNVEDAVAERLAAYTGSTDTAHAHVDVPKQQVTTNDPRAALECSWTHSC